MIDTIRDAIALAEDAIRSRPPQGQHAAYRATANRRDRRAVTTLERCLDCPASLNAFATWFAASGVDEAAEAVLEAAGEWAADEPGAAEAFGARWRGRAGVVA